jgi:hypothetical protein
MKLINCEHVGTITKLVIDKLKENERVVSVQFCIPQTLIVTCDELSNDADVSNVCMSIARRDDEATIETIDEQLNGKFKIVVSL